MTGACRRFGTMSISRKAIYENQLKVCSLLEVYPKMLSPKDLSKETGMSVNTIRGMIGKMTNRYLLSEELVNGETFYFYGYREDKRKTIAFIQERIRLATKENGNG